MKFFKAIKAKDSDNIIQWDGWANSLEELQNLGEQNNPLILPEELVPDMQFGVFPMKIVAGQIVAHTTADLEAFEAVYNKSLIVGLQSFKIRQINKGRFLYDSHYFPMDETARLRYQAFQFDIEKGDAEFIDIEGVKRTVLEADIPVFMSKMYKQIKLITFI